MQVIYKHCLQAERLPRCEDADADGLNQACRHPGQVLVKLFDRHVLAERDQRMVSQKAAQLYGSWKAVELDIE